MILFYYENIDLNYSNNQSILKEIIPGISFFFFFFNFILFNFTTLYWFPMEGMMVKLKPQYFGHLMRRVDSLEKTLMLGGIGGRRRRG